MAQDEDDEEEGEEEGGGLSKSGKELKKLLGKANGLNESDEDDDDDDDVSFVSLLWVTKSRCLLLFMFKGDRIISSFCICCFSQENYI